MSKPEVSRMLTLSTGHVTQYTRDMLAREADEDNFGLSVYEKAGFGFIIYLPEPSDFPDPDRPYVEAPSDGPYFGISDTVPKDLQDVLRYCHDMGCNILCLDSDGPEIPYLRFYGEDEVYEAPDDQLMVPLCKTDIPVSLARPLAGYFGDWYPVGKILGRPDRLIHETTGLSFRQIAEIRKIYTDMFGGKGQNNGHT